LHRLNFNLFGRTHQLLIIMYSVFHLVTGSRNQLGGIASVVKEILKLGENSADFRLSAVWNGEKSTSCATASLLWERMVSKVNRTLSRDPANHPYRFPQINNLRSSALEFKGKTVVHVHKPNLWRQAARWKSENRDVGLVFHAHSVDGFTGGCVLESDCPILVEECRNCPIVRSVARVLPKSDYDA
jgi:hypothetical protein